MADQKVVATNGFSFNCCFLKLYKERLYVAIVLQARKRK